MVEFRFARFAAGLNPRLDHGPLAQLAERRADNAEVGGSSPPRPTTILLAFGWLTRDGTLVSSWSG